MGLLQQCKRPVNELRDMSQVLNDELTTASDPAA